MIVCPPWAVPAAAGSAPQGEGSPIDRRQPVRPAARSSPRDKPSPGRARLPIAGFAGRKARAALPMRRAPLAGAGPRSARSPPRWTNALDHDNLGSQRAAALDGCRARGPAGRTCRSTITVSPRRNRSSARRNTSSYTRARAAGEYRSFTGAGGCAPVQKFAPHHVGPQQLAAEFAASARDRVVLPVPDNPVTTTNSGRAPARAKSDRPVGDSLGLGAGGCPAIGRQLAGPHRGDRGSHASAITLVKRDQSGIRSIAALPFVFGHHFGAECFDANRSHSMIRKEEPGRQYRSAANRLNSTQSKTTGGSRGRCARAADRRAPR